MTTSELKKEICKSLPNLPQGEVIKIVDYIIMRMRTTLTSGGKIEIRGFGSFVAKISPRGSVYIRFKKH
jgi:nucleoid DNA-binding protein